MINKMFSDLVLKSSSMPLTQIAVPVKPVNDKPKIFTKFVVPENYM